ncbi:MAG: hypothetical protein KA764_00955 [Anaerolineales bacterium]|nr:hypothetical protein [Anaerolineales bacterium]
MDDDLALLARHFSVFILTQADETQRDQLWQLGVRAPIMQYLNFESIQDPGGCDRQPRRNQAAYKAGDFCWIEREHPDWFLRDINGQPIRLNGDRVMMDPAQPGWREFWLQRAREGQETLGWQGVFMDNVRSNLSRRLGGVSAAGYPNDALYQAAVEDFLSYVYLDYFQPTGRPLLANIAAHYDTSAWPRYLRYLDGAMEERFAVGWESGDYLTLAQWEAQMTQMEQTQASGKYIILVAQGDPGDLPRQTFAFASYLLISGGRAAFRYSLGDSGYAEAWLYDNYQLELGAPLGLRLQQGDEWRREFQHGRVMVNPVTHETLIEPAP